jgi:asparagine synthase (glutamine-hydrolysing)
MGFGVPLDRWFRGELKDELRAVLLDPVALGRGLFQPEAVASLVNEHIEGRRDHAQRLWTLLMLELWFRKHLDSAQ